MSPFMSSMPPPGLIEMPPESNTTPLPTKATGLSLALPPFQRMMTTRLSRAGPWPTASSARMPSFSQRLLVENLDLDAELRERRGAVRELLGPEHVRRLVDEVAGDADALGEAVAALAALRAAAGSATAKRSCVVPAVLVVLLLLRLVAVELVEPQPRPERHLGDVLGRGREPRERRHAPCAVTAGELARDRRAEIGVDELPAIGLAADPDAISRSAEARPGPEWSAPCRACP